MPARLPNVSVIGAGPVGSVLALALHEQNYPVVSVISRTGRDAVALARATGCKRASTQISDLSPATELLLLTVGDGSIAAVAKEAAAVKRLKFPKMFAVHCSGAYGSDLLAPLRRKGATVASVHPVQTFPASQKPARLRSKIRGIYYGIEGDAGALKKAQELVTALGGKFIVIPAAMKPLYHVASVFASNYLIVYLDTVAQLSEKLGLTVPWTDVFGPLMAQTMENVLRDSPAESLTGPVVRGDFDTIRLHCETLAKHAPQLIPIYAMNGIELARTARRSDRLSDESYGTLVETLQKAIASRPETKKVKR